MLEKAAWPGVSRNVMMPPLSGMVTWKAPMCCVIPPASPAATLDFLKASKRLVLPWSTCPMIVTTGGRVIASLSPSYARASFRSQSLLTRVSEESALDIKCGEHRIYLLLAHA